MKTFAAIIRSVSWCLIFASAAVAHAGECDPKKFEGTPFDVQCKPYSPGQVKYDQISLYYDVAPGDGAELTLRLQRKGQPDSCHTVWHPNRYAYYAQEFKEKDIRLVLSPKETLHFSGSDLLGGNTLGIFDKEYYCVY